MSESFTLLLDNKQNNTEFIIEITLLTGKNKYSSCEYN